MDLLEKISKKEIDPEDLSQKEQHAVLVAIETALRDSSFFPSLALGVGTVPIVTNSTMLNAFNRDHGVQGPEAPTEWQDASGKTYRIRSSRSVRLPTAKFETVAYILEDPETGRVRLLKRGRSPTHQRLRMLLISLGARFTTSLEEAEEQARTRLNSILRPGQRRSYLVTDTFVETSPKSQLDYILRRNRPTLVMSRQTNQALCALCFHPLGYYKGSWAGFLPPSDELFDVVTLIRGDEPELWKRANQFPLSWVESGL